MNELWIVPGERNVERLARSGQLAETLARLRARLATALLPDVRFVDRRETRLVLSIALRSGGKPATQLSLFSEPTGPKDPLLEGLRTAGGASWMRAVAALDAAIGVFRAGGATAEHLDRVASRAAGVTSARARTIAAAMRTLDEALEASGARDGRLVAASLAGVVADTGPMSLAAVLGADRLRARWIVAWERADLALWRALDEKLSRAGGYARIALPSFDRPLEATRERDPLEIVADTIARDLDGAPEIEPIAPVLGDLTGAPLPPSSVRRVWLARAADPVAQAETAARAVSSALAKGAAIERVAIAYPSRTEGVLLPIRRALEVAGVIVYEARGAAPSSASVASAALLALEISESLERSEVARLLASGYVDPKRLLGEEDRAEAQKKIARMSRALETNATAAGADPQERFVRTAAPKEDDAPAARRVAEVLSRAGGSKTRREHAAAARLLFAELGIGARAGRGGLEAFARDEAPRGVDRVERLAIARDARAWEALLAALDAYEAVAERSHDAIDSELFRLELAEALDFSASMPGAGRAGAVRLASIAELAGDELDMLIVVDANEGSLPRDARRDALVSDALAEAVGRASKGVFAPDGGGVDRARELAGLALAAAEASRIVIITTAEDETGTPSSPSFVVEVLARAGVTIHDSAERASPVVKAVRKTSLDVAGRAARERIREGFFLDPARPLSDLVGALDGSSPSASLASLLSDRTGGGDRALAVTSIERFARCAFMGYATVVLGARDVERQSEMPDAREEGNIGHLALAAAFNETKTLWPRRPRDAEAILTLGVAAADAVLSAAPGHAPLRAVVRLRVRESVRAVLKRALEDDDWDFALAEQAFGDRRGAAAWSPLVLDDGDLRLALRGSIDRVDRAHRDEAARVVDYKRSQSTVRSNSGALGETALQVPLYACVASRRLGVPATGIYAPMQARDLAVPVRASTKAQAKMDHLVTRSEGLAPVERRVLEIASDARRGRFAPLPADETECTFCDVSGGCRKPRFAMAPLEDIEEPQ